MNKLASRPEAEIKDAVRKELMREPFVPFRIHLKDGRKFEIAHRHVARLLSFGVLVFLGLREGTHQAEGYDRFSYEHIGRLEPRPGKSRPSRRRKAS